MGQLGRELREKSTTAVMEFLFCFELVYWSTGESCECHAELRSQYNMCLPSTLHPTTHFLILIQYKLNWNTSMASWTNDCCSCIVYVLCCISIYNQIHGFSFVKKLVTVPCDTCHVSHGQMWCIQQGQHWHCHMPNITLPTSTPAIMQLSWLWASVKW